MRGACDARIMSRRPPSMPDIAMPGMANACRHRRAGRGAFMCSFGVRDSASGTRRPELGVQGSEADAWDRRLPLQRSQKQSCRSNHAEAIMQRSLRMHGTLAANDCDEPSHVRDRRPRARLATSCRLSREEQTLALFERMPAPLGTRSLKPPRDCCLHLVRFRRLDHLAPTVISAVVAHAVHHLRLPTVATLHELRRLEFVVVFVAALSGTRLRMSPLRDSHGLQVDWMRRISGWRAWALRIRVASFTTRSPLRRGIRTNHTGPEDSA